MIVFGTRNRSKTLDSGQFFCPRCQAQRRYDRKQARPYFALYFIPIFPVGEGREYIECQTCGAAFETRVLNAKRAKPASDLAGQMNRVKDQLAAGTPVEYVVRDLTAAGLEWAVARAIVDTQAGADRKTCETCGLDYTSAVEVCTVCHSPLTNVKR